MEIKEKFIIKKARKSRIDLTGKRFGRLTVLGYAGTGKQGTYWKCRCDCGKDTVVLSHSLRSGRTKSCGCYNKEVTSIRNRVKLKKIERLQEQLEEAQHTIYCIANTDGSDCKTILETIIRNANLYLERFGLNK